MTSGRQVQSPNLLAPIGRIQDVINAIRMTEGDEASAHESVPLVSSMTVASGNSRTPMQAGIYRSMADQNHRSDDTTTQSPMDQLETNQGSLRRQMFPLDVFSIAIGTLFSPAVWVYAGHMQKTGGSGAVMLACIVSAALSGMIMHSVGHMWNVWASPRPLVNFTYIWVDTQVVKPVKFLLCCAHSLPFAAFVLFAARTLRTFDAFHPWANAVLLVFLTIIPILVNLTAMKGLRKWIGMASIGSLLCCLLVFGIMIYVSPNAHSHRNGTVRTKLLKREYLFRSTDAGATVVDVITSLPWALSMFLPILSILVVLGEIQLDQRRRCESTTGAEGMKWSQKEVNVLGARMLWYRIKWTAIPAMTLLMFGLFMVSQNIAVNDDRLLSKLDLSAFVLSARDKSAELGTGVAVLLALSSLCGGIVQLFVGSLVLYKFHHHVDPDASYDDRIATNQNDRASCLPLLLSATPGIPALILVIMTDKWTHEAMDFIQSACVCCHLVAGFYRSFGPFRFWRYCEYHGRFGNTARFEVRSETETEEKILRHCLPNKYISGAAASACLILLVASPLAMLLRGDNYAWFWGHCIILIPFLAWLSALKGRQVVQDGERDIHDLFLNDLTELDQFKDACNGSFLFD